MSKYEVQRQISWTESFWEWLLLQNDFKGAIKSHGYYRFHKDVLIDQYYKWLERERPQTDSIHSISTIKKTWPAASFGIERLSQTPKILNNNELYVVRAGGGNFVVFDMRDFLPPYLSLDWTEYSRAIEELPVRLPRGYQRLAIQFRTQWNEHTFIKALHFCGAFSLLVERLSRNHTTKYVTGPTGPIMLRFPFWMRRNGVNSDSTHRLVPFVHDGVVDLDECLYPKDTNAIIPIEAKLQHFPDLAWHKLTFPCYRFIGQPHFDSDEEESWRVPRAPALRSNDCKSQIAPVYCTYHAPTRQAILHLFPRVQLYSGKVPSLSTQKVHGVILNEKKQMLPAQTFRVDMSWI